MRRFTEQRAGQRLVFGPGAEAQAAEQLQLLGARRVLVVGTERHRAGADRLVAQLGERAVGSFHGAAPQVPRSVVDAAVARARDLDADWVLAHGGGTAIGLCKAMALELDLGIAAVPTTYSGSERTRIWGVSAGGSKTTGRDPRVLPRLVLYDPELLTVLRFEVARVSLFNALAHAVEALYAADASHALRDRAEQSTIALVRGLQGLHADPTSVEAASDALYGAALAGECLDRASMGLHHALAHTLGGSFGLPHAEVHAILLPHTVARNTPEAARRRLARALSCEDPARALYDLAVRTGIPTSLGSLGFLAEQIPAAAERAIARGYPNPVPTTPEHVRRLLADATKGTPPERQ